MIRLFKRCSICKQGQSKVMQSLRWFSSDRNRTADREHTQVWGNILQHICCCCHRSEPYHIVVPVSGGTQTARLELQQFPGTTCVAYCACHRDEDVHCCWLCVHMPLWPANFHTSTDFIYIVSLCLLEHDTGVSFHSCPILLPQKKKSRSNPGPE